MERVLPLGSPRHLLMVGGTAVEDLVVVLAMGPTAQPPVAAVVEVVVAAIVATVVTITTTTITRKRTRGMTTTTMQKKKRTKTRRVPRRDKGPCRGRGPRLAQAQGLEATITTGVAMPTLRTMVLGVPAIKSTMPIRRMPAVVIIAAAIHPLAVDPTATTVMTTRNLHRHPLHHHRRMVVLVLVVVIRRCRAPEVADALRY